MGKGDKKSKRGKIVIGSFGVRRAHRKKRTIIAVPKTQDPGPKKVKEEKLKVSEPVTEQVIPPVPDEAAPVKKPVKKTAKKTEEAPEGGDGKPKTHKPKKVQEDAEPGKPEPPAEA